VNKASPRRSVTICGPLLTVPIDEQINKELAFMSGRPDSYKDVQILILEGDFVLSQTEIQRSKCVYTKYK